MIVVPILINLHRYIAQYNHDQIKVAREEREGGGGGEPLRSAV